MTLLHSRSLVPPADPVWGTKSNEASESFPHAFRAGVSCLRGL